MVAMEQCHVYEELKHWREDPKPQMRIKQCPCRIITAVLAVASIVLLVTVVVLVAVMLTAKTPEVEELKKDFKLLENELKNELKLLKAMVQQTHSNQTNNDGVTCNNPGSLLHGSVSGDNFTFGNTIRYHCDRGYNLVGSSTRTCQASGTWSGNQPLCVAVSCGDPVVVPNSVRSGSTFTYRSIVHYQCNTGYYITGSSGRTCQSSGEWSGQAPTCRVKDRFTKPLLDLNMTAVNPEVTYAYQVAPLPMGEAFVIRYLRSNTEQVVKVNSRGSITDHVHDCLACDRYSLRGLLLFGHYLCIIYGNGTLVEIRDNNVGLVRVYHVPSVSLLSQYCSLSHDPSVIPDTDQLLLADERKGEIFSYRLSTRQKVVLLTGLSTPSSVSYMIYNTSIYYVVCDYGRHQVHVYNTTWGLYKTLGNTRGSNDGQFSNPISAVGLPDGSIIVSDQSNRRISKFTIHGAFVRHLLTRSDGLSRPRAMSIRLPYLWLIDQDKYLYRYKLY